MSPYREIVIGARTQFVVKVSPEDYDFLMQWRWTFARSHGQWSGLIYARRSIRGSDGSNETILMHRVIIAERMGLKRPSELHFVDHDNGDSLDNRRVNDKGQAQLAWLTNAENMAKRKHTPGKIIVPLPPESGLSEIPY
jgi:hypothetical protein